MAQIPSQELSIAISSTPTHPPSQELSIAISSTPTHPPSQELSIAMTSTPTHPPLATIPDAPPSTQTDALETALPLIVQLVLSEANKWLGFPTEAHKSVFRLYAIAKFLVYTLLLVLVVLHLARWMGLSRWPAADNVKLAIWITLALSFFTVALGTILNWVS